MTDIASARIIPFPIKRVRASAQPGQDQPGRDRLAAALASLDAALAEQRVAMSAFRESLGALGQAVGTLETGLNGYAGQLGTLRDDVREVNAAARDLETWADRALARAR